MAARSIWASPIGDVAGRSLYLWTSRGGGRVGESSFCLVTSAEDIQERQQSCAPRNFETANGDVGNHARLIALRDASDMIFPHHGVRDAVSRDLHLDPARG